MLVHEEEFDYCLMHLIMDSGKKRFSNFLFKISIKRVSNLPVPVWLFYTFILIVLFAIGEFSYTLLKNRLIQQRSNEISSIATLKVQQVSDFRLRRYHEAQLFLDNQTFIKTVKSYFQLHDSISYLQLNDWLKPIYTNHFYEDILLIDPATRRTLFAFKSKSLVSRPEIESDDFNCLGSDSIKFGDLTFDETNDSIRIYILVPLLLRTPNNTEKIGVIKFIIDPYKNLYSLIQSMPNSGKTGEVLVVKRRGNDVVYLNELRFKKNSALKFRLPVTLKELPAARAISGDESVMEGIDYRGRKVLAVARSIPGSDWRLIVKFDTDEIYADLKTIGLLVLSMLILLIVLSGFGLNALWAHKKLIYYKSRVSDLNTIQRLNQVYRLLSEVEQAIVKFNKKEELLNEACQIISNNGGYPLCWIGMINSKTNFIKPIEHCKNVMLYHETIKVTVSENLKESRDPSVINVLAGKYFICNNIWKDPIMKVWRQKAIPSHFNSMAVFPLLQNSETIGAIYYYENKIGFFTNDEIALLERLSTNLSYALEKIELQQKEEISRRLLEENEKTLKRQNDELEIARERAEESNRLKSAFLANMSHEIRTPLNAIIGFADLLKQADNSKEEQFDYCQIIVSQSDYLLRIISDILDISKLDSHTVSIYRETISLNGFLDELLRIYKNKLVKIRKKQIFLNCTKYLSADQFEISTDVVKFRQIFTNLIDNAIKFTDRGEIKFGYHTHDKEMLTCFVSDTGIGILPEYRDNIFDIFRQAENKAKKNYGGTGLGLAISRGNAQLLGGNIKVDSEVDKGSIFYFTVNYVKNGDNSPKFKPKVFKTISKTKEILLVEDDLCTIEYIKIILSQVGFKTHVAHNGKEVEKFYDLLPQIDMVLLDMTLPDCNGFDLVKKIKSRYKEIPVIVQTAMTIVNDGKEFFEAGCDGYITKPYKREHLIELIQSHISL